MAAQVTENNDVSSFFLSETEWEEFLLLACLDFGIVVMFNTEEINYNKFTILSRFKLLLYKFESFSI